MRIFVRHDVKAAGKPVETLEDYETPLGLGNVSLNIGDCYE